MTLRPTIFALLLSAAALSAQQPNLTTLFTHQAPVYVSTQELSRLELPSNVLAECRADLSDLRLFDRSGNEVAFLLDSGRPTQAETRVGRRYDLTTLDVSQGEIRSETAKPLHRESYVLALPPDFEPAQPWALSISTQHASFVRTVQVASQSGSGDRVTLVEQTSLFRLTNPSREKTQIGLPRFSGERLMVTIEGEDGFYLNPTFQLTTSRSFAAAEQVAVTLTLLSRRDVESQTILELERPRGLVPQALVLKTSTPSFYRGIEVRDQGPASGDRLLGAKKLYRVVAASTVEDVELPMAPARGDTLRVVIENGDSPPLADLSLVAALQRPGILFSLGVPTEGEPSGVLRFGGGRAFRPTYDLQALSAALDPPTQGAQAVITEQFVTLPSALLGEIEPNPDFDPSPILSFAMRPGARVDPRLYTHRREFKARPSEDGLVRFSLGLDDLARLRPDLSDLRIADSELRQWAYLVERDAAEIVRALTVERQTPEGGEPRYALTPPVAPASLNQIELQTNTAFFDRPYVLRATLDDDEFTLAQGRITRRSGDLQPIRIAFAGRRVDSLALVVLDGDDAPLRFSFVKARFPAPYIYLAAPEGKYELLMGDKKSSAPSYEIEQVRNIVLSVESGDIEPSPLTKNSRYNADAREAPDSRIQQIALWVALVAAVLFLGVLTLRLVRREE